jgi:predicted metal-dependent enzyme (double-stranded beta helix superfamily)
MKSLARTIELIKAQVQEKGNLNVRELETIFTGYSGTDWKNYLTTENGQLKNTILHEDEHLKMLLICWRPGQKSSKHGHPAGGGLIRVLSGQLSETRFDPVDQDIETGTFRYNPEDEAAYIHDDEAYHVVENPGQGIAFSLHLYSHGIAAQRSNALKISRRPERLRAA